MRAVDWSAVDALVDRARSPHDLVAHRLHLVGARRARALGVPVAGEVADAERLATLQALALAPLLTRARAAYDGRLMVMKGPEVAARYRDPSTRAYKDVDLLAEDAPAAQRALLAAGFVEIDDPDLYRDIHHLRPLIWPGLPLPIELHAEPKWLPSAAPPAAAELFAAARPGTGALAGYLRPAPAHHAVLLAAHGWAHQPLRRAGDLLDVAVLAEEAAPGEVAAVARSWGCERLWRTAERAADSLFAGDRRPVSLRVWGRHLVRVRERTVFETHLTRWLDPLWTAPERRLRAAGRAAAEDLRPAFGEGWSSKLERAWRAARGAAMQKSEYDKGATT
jgi:Uncharacterised nucleotidyltransferase